MIVVKAKNKAEFVRLYAQTLAREQGVFPSKKHISVAERVWEAKKKK